MIMIRGRWRWNIILSILENDFGKVKSEWKLQERVHQRQGWCLTRLKAVPKDFSTFFHGMDDQRESGSYPNKLDALGASVSDEDANHKFLRSLPPAWDSLAMTMRTKKNTNTLSIDDLYNNLSVFEQDIQKTSSSSLTSDNVAFYHKHKASSRQE
ncbi:hypothetical protein Tco_1092230 [Tanacetum coccineum]|uniref:Uncharacterized protein n=1 Tax=Tanacetum coccineum TaxID=301880 RepID=A0ABQ5IBN0_9ASTR